MTDIETFFNRVDTARTYAEATRAIIAVYFRRESWQARSQIHAKCWFMIG